MSVVLSVSCVCLYRSVELHSRIPSKLRGGRFAHFTDLLHTLSYSTVSRSSHRELSRAIPRERDRPNMSRWRSWRGDAQREPRWIASPLDPARSDRNGFNAQPTPQRAQVRLHVHDRTSIHSKRLRAVAKALVGNIVGKVSQSRHVALLHSEASDVYVRIQDLCWRRSEFLRRLASVSSASNTPASKINFKVSGFRACGIYCTRRSPKLLVEISVVVAEWLRGAHSATAAANRAKPREVLIAVALGLAAKRQGFVCASSNA